MRDIILVISLLGGKEKNMSDYREITTCRCCSSEKLTCILDLKNQPLANSYHDKSKILNKYPLKLNLCLNCYHSQLSVVVDPSLLFKNYLYVSGTTDTLRDYFDFFAKFTMQRFKYLNNKKIENVLDIACNDGSQLDCYKRLGVETFGVDPAENLHELSSRNHHVVCDFFPTKIEKKFDVIVAQNVFAHTHNIKEFLMECSRMLNENGVIYIQTSQSNMIKNNEFDTIYHEHLSFFNSYSMKTLVESCNLKLNNIFKFDIHGTSYIFEIQEKTKDTNLDSILELEKKEGLYELSTYEKFSENATEITKKLKNTIDDFKNNDYITIGYGAAAKGMTLLNFGDIHLDYIIDDNPMKENLYTPGTNIPIKNIKILQDLKDQKILFVPLAWNFFDEIKKRIMAVREGGKDVYVKYFPKLKLEIA